MRCGAPVSGGRRGPRHRRPGRPADTGMAVQLGGGDRAGGVVRGAVGAVEEPAAADRTPQTPAPHPAGGGGAREPIRRRRVRARALQRLRREPGVVGQLQRDLHLRGLLDRDADRQRAARRRLRRAQPVALLRESDSLARRAPGTASLLAPAPALPRPSRTVAGRGPARGLRLAGARVRGTRQPVDPGRIVTRLLPADAGRHAGLRRGDVGRPARMASAPTSDCSRGCRR